MIETKDVFLHNYGQLVSMLHEYSGVMTAVNTMSMRYLTENDAVLVHIVDSTYYVYRALDSLIKALSAAGDEGAKQGLIDSREIADKLEREWREVKKTLSGGIPDPDHPLLALNFIVGKEAGKDNEEEGG